MSTQQTTLDHAKVNEFLGKAIQDVAATFHAGLVLIGDRLGLYRAMAGAGGLTPAELAKRTGTHQRYVAEWLSAQAAGGYVTYDAATGRFTFPPEQAFVLLDADLPGAFMLGVGSVQDESKIADAFRTTSEEVARTAGLGKDAVQRKDRVRSDKTQRRLREMVEIVNKVEPRFGSALMAYAWYRSEPLSGFSGQTAMQQVRDGRAEDVLDYIDAIDAGVHA